MKTVTDEEFAPLSSRVGYFHAPIEEVARAVEAWRRDLAAQVTVTRLVEPFPSVLHALEPLTMPGFRREMLVPMGEWTAYFNAQLHGTALAEPVIALSLMNHWRAVVITSNPTTVGLPGIVRGRNGMVSFELFGPDRTDFLNCVRAISLTSERGTALSFDTRGEVQPFEEAEAYSARRKKDRFTSDMLERYCRALGFDPFNNAAYGNEAILVSTIPDPPFEPQTLSLTEARAFFDITPDQAQISI